MISTASANAHWWKTKVAITALIWLVYPIVFVIALPYAKEATGVLGFMPVIVSSWLWGFKRGTIIAFLGGFVTPVLYYVFASAYFNPITHLIPALFQMVTAMLAGYFSDIRATLKHQNALISHQADYDTLTGLLNRLSLTRKLGSLIQGARGADDQLGVLFIDLDRFKTINDTLGHATGDALLQTVARKLGEATRRHDLLARLGGDEFVVVLRDLKQASDAVNVAQKILELLAQPHNLNKKTVVAQASIGISLFPDDGDTVDELLNRADNAMYKVKWQGKNGVHRFNGEGAEDSRRSRLARDFRKTLEAEGLSLAYQPIVRVTDGKLVALEALLRWQHPELGPISPLEILPIAADLGMDKALGSWILETACKQSLSYISLAPPPVVLNVNVSPNHLADPTYASQVQGILKQAGFSAGKLVLEITEETFLTRHEDTLNNLHALRQLGIRIAIDDFGVGYSSLARLRTLPIDILKLDRSFIGDLNSETCDEANSFVQAIVQIGQSLGKKVVAEGVETAEQFGNLGAVSCDFAQGYFIARPAPLEALPYPFVILPDVLPSVTAGEAPYTKN